MFSVTLKRLKATDIDQEVKERAISCMGHMVCHLGDHLRAELQGVLTIFLERLKNEITRLTAVRTVALIAASPLKVQFDFSQRTPSLCVFFPFSYEKKNVFLISLFLSLSGPDRLVVHPARSSVSVGIFPEEEPARPEARHAGVFDRAGHASRRQHQTGGVGACDVRTSCPGGRERHARVAGAALTFTLRHIPPRAALHLLTCLEFKVIWSRVAGIISRGRGRFGEHVRGNHGFLPGRIVQNNKWLKIMTDCTILY